MTRPSMSLTVCGSNAHWQGFEHDELGSMASFEAKYSDCVGA
jgi:hypothetical protein